MAENSVLDLAFGKDYNHNFLEAHSCLQANTDGKLMSRHTTVNDIQANEFAISVYMRIVLKPSQNTWDIPYSHLCRNDLYLH